MCDLLTRDEFRRSVFERDGHRCVFCGKPAKDAHHILERRLWGDGGYYIDNGASVCEGHHLLCESTDISVEDVRLACGITKKVLPEHLYSDQVYDKWGNPVLEDGRRLRGELYSDESVQRILRKDIDFVSYVKYPRTYHLPWSDNITDDDRVMADTSCFSGKPVVVSVKMDGENSSLYQDYFHARSVDGRNHPSRSWVKNFWNTIRFDIPDGWRVCGENLYAKHSIGYENLESYFYGFSIWNEHNICLGWADTVEWFGLLGITPVTALYRGVWDEKKIRGLVKEMDFEKQEGYVVRLDGAFGYRDFRKSVGKYVRPRHVQTVKHWMYGQRIEPNRLKDK